MSSDSGGPGRRSQGSTPGNPRGRASIPPQGSPARGRSGRPANPTGGKNSARKGGKPPGGYPPADGSLVASKSRKQRSPLWTKISIGLGALMILATIGAYATFQAGISELNKSVNTQNLLDPKSASKPTLKGNTISGPINILMVGVDATGHTDSIMIAHFPASHNEVYFVSLPRDTRVNVPGGGTNKINAVYDSGKIPELQATIKLNWGISVASAVIINFQGFASIVNKLGGVDMYVDETTYSIHHGYLNNNKADRYKGYPYKIDPNSGVPICSIRGVKWKPETADECTIPGVKEMVYPKGPYHFDAYDALDFVRCRDGLAGTDYGRQRHQQQFIKAVMAKVYAKGLSDPLQLLGLIQSMNQAFTFDKNGVPLEDWLFTLDKIGPNNMITIKTNDGQYVNAEGPPDGHGSEQGLNADTLDLLNRVKTDTGVGDPVGAFLAVHPTWAANA